MDGDFALLLSVTVTPNPAGTSIIAPAARLPPHVIALMGMFVADAGDATPKTRRPTAMPAMDAALIFKKSP